MRSGDPLYRDAGHLSVQGATLAVPFLESELSRIDPQHSDRSP